jgi:hypothetical protein
MDTIATAYRRAWVVVCCLAFIAGVVFCYLHQPRPQDVSSTDVVPYLSPRSMMVIANAPPDNQMQQDVHDNLQIPLPVGVTGPDRQAFEQDYISGAAFVIAQRRSALWIRVTEYVVGFWVLSLGVALLASHWLPPPPASP